MKQQLVIGCSSFYNRQWQGIFYPGHVPSKEWFEYYATQFNTFEINSSFYKFPTVRSLKGWCRRVPEAFTFSLKVPKEITHSRRLQECDTLLDEFYNVVHEGLAGKLACVLFQFPPSFHYSEENLARVTAAAKTGFSNVVEFRHSSWWRSETYDALAAHGITFCAPSYPKLPWSIVKTTGTGYIRLHGDPKLFYGEYTPEYLETLYAEISNAGFDKVYVYFNNTAGTGGILNAVAFKNIQSS